MSKEERRDVTEYIEEEKKKKRDVGEGLIAVRGEKAEKNGVSRRWERDAPERGGRKRAHGHGVRTWATPFLRPHRTRSRERVTIPSSLTIEDKKQT